MAESLPGQESKLKHLEMIQGIINRLAHTSFLLKGWSVVIVSALLAAGMSLGDSLAHLVAFLPCLVLWGLDGYYLMEERAFRDLYDHVRTLEDGRTDFSMRRVLPAGVFRAWVRATISKTVLLFHGVVLITIVLVLLYRSGTTDFRAREAEPNNQRPGSLESVPGEGRGAHLTKPASRSTPGAQR